MVSHPPSALFLLSVVRWLLVSRTCHYKLLASASLRLAHCCYIVCPESNVQSQSHPEKDPMGPLIYPVGSLSAGFDKGRCRIKSRQGVRVCTAIRSTISDRIIATLPALTTRAALVKCRRICTSSLHTMAKVIVLCYAHLLCKSVQSNKGCTQVHYSFYCISRSLCTFMGNSCAPCVSERS